MNRLTTVVNILNKLPWYLVQASAWIYRQLVRLAVLLIILGVSGEVVCLTFHVPGYRILAGTSGLIAYFGLALLPAWILSVWPQAEQYIRQRIIGPIVPTEQEKEED